MLFAYLIYFSIFGRNLVGFNFLIWSGWTCVMGAPYREVNSQGATGPKLKVEDKDRVNN